MKGLGDYVGELFRLENSFGNVLEFNKEIYLPVYSGFGTARVNFATRKGYRQDGSSLMDYFLEERTLSVEIYHADLETREEWWELRRALVNFFRGVVGSPIVLSVLQPSGTIYSIDVYADPGPEFSSMPEDNNWNIRETIALRAFNPLWYNASTTELELTATQDTQLVFPITFPITFGVSGTIYASGALDYQGSWKTYPIITLQGPYTTATLQLLQKGTFVQLGTELVAGESRTINFDPANIYVVDEDGNSCFDELSLPTNFVDFFIEPAPLGETEIIQVALLNGSVGISAVIVEYREQYLGI